jgi:hypothetical protein
MLAAAFSTAASEMGRMTIFGCRLVRFWMWWLLGRLSGERNPLTVVVNMPKRLLADSLLIRQIEGRS